MANKILLLLIIAVSIISVFLYQKVNTLSTTGEKPSKFCHSGSACAGGMPEGVCAPGSRCT